MAETSSTQSSLLTHTGGFTETNGYLLRTPDGFWLAVDAPTDFAEFCLSRNIRPAALLLTHSHFDHVDDAAAVVAEAECPVYAHMVSTPESRLELLFRPMNLRADDYPVDHLLAHGDKINLRGLEGTVLHIPGHSPDSLAFYFPSIGSVFSGDTLMSGTVGRTDFPGGSMQVLLDGIDAHLMTLPDETKVYAGHMLPTTIGAERRNLKMIRKSYT